MKKIRNIFGHVLNNGPMGPPQPIANVLAEKRKLDLPPLPEIPDEAFKEFVVVMTVYNRPDMAVPCIESFLMHTPESVRLLIVDDASDHHTVNVLHKITKIANADCEGRITFVRNEENQKYTRTINRGFTRAFNKMGARWACALNSDVLLPAGWAHRMLRCLLSDPAIQMASPWILNDGGALTILPVNGAGYAEADDRVRALVPNPTFPRAITPVGALMAVGKEAWEKIGPFDTELSPHGYGEEVDFWAKMEQADVGRSAIVDDLLIYHAAHQSFGQSSKQLLDETGLKLHAKYEHYFRTMASKYPQNQKMRDMLNTDLANVEIKGSKRQNFAFYITSIQLCGGVLSLVNICNRLNIRGMNATIAFERDDFGDWSRFTPNFGPLHLRSHDTPGWKASGGFTRGMLYATAFFTGEYVTRIGNAHPGIATAAFVQDREDYFRMPDGDLQYKRKEEFAPYLELAKKPLSVVNSNWVQESMERELWVKVQNYIPIGVDPNLFYPRGNRPNPGEGKVRILTFSRPTTPRRGYDVLDFCYKALKEKYGDAIELFTYDQRPEVDVPCKHLGKLQQTKLAEWMSSCHILLETSSVQGWGMPAQEMMASAGAVVTFANGGIANYGKHAENCVIVPRAEGKEKFLEMVCRLVDEPLAAHDLGVKARASAERLSWDRVADAWWTLVAEGPPDE